MKLDSKGRRAAKVKVEVKRGEEKTKRGKYTSVEDYPCGRESSTSK